MLKGICFPAAEVSAFWKAPSHRAPEVRFASQRQKYTLQRKSGVFGQQTTGKTQIPI